MLAVREPNRRQTVDAKRPTIAEMQAMLEKDDDVKLTILPNGEIRAEGHSSDQDPSSFKPLTMRDNLGGEY